MEEKDKFNTYKLKYLYKLMDINSILLNSDTNYIVGLIVIIFSAKLLNDKNKQKNKHLGLQTTLNFLFLGAIIIIANTNIILGGILSILYLSINV